MISSKNKTKWQPSSEKCPHAIVNSTLKYGSEKMLMEKQAMNNDVIQVSQHENNVN